jgi:hypothetical protein
MWEWGAFNTYLSYSFHPPTSFIDLCNEELCVAEITGLRDEFGYHLGLCHDRG